ncbi:PspC domain-containing protein [Microbacterium schleiferi]|uniref:PspC domain-containing protein n=1 Tax=Microbacterium schleiferi TaxID=69362 RepID=A0A7S8MX37_9MICO|nr:PspC domain-containing protein [Microbacterium schleiferi]QPE04874.1 PspC domain-containing protein [Microbacterium schleiferi]
MNQLIRPRQGRLIAGVCAAVADRFGWDRTLVRVLTVAAVIFAGLSLWIYILLWIIIPSDG